MGASLAVVLGNIWIKSFEKNLSNESQTPSVGIKDAKEKFPDCHQKTAWNRKAVACEECENWYHIKCQNIDKEQYKKLGDVDWICLNCKNIPVGG